MDHEPKASQTNEAKLDRAITIVGRLIDAMTAGKTAFVSNDAIAVALLADSDGRALADEWGKEESGQSVANKATNIVAWFSSRWTQDEHFLWRGWLDRSPAGDPIAYRRKPLNDGGGTDPDAAAWEGKPLVYAHVTRERNASLRKAKLAQARATGKPLACEACGTVPEEIYPGQAGDIVEVHHRRPLLSYEAPTLTKLDDLALLCPTCHRAIHRTSDPFGGIQSVEEFRKCVFSA